MATKTKTKGPALADLVTLAEQRQHAINAVAGAERRVERGQAALADAEGRVQTARADRDAAVREKGGALTPRLEAARQELRDAQDNAEEVRLLLADADRALAGAQDDLSAAPAEVDAVEVSRRLRERALGEAKRLDGAIEEAAAATRALLDAMGDAAPLAELGVGIPPNAFLRSRGRTGWVWRLLGTLPWRVDPQNGSAEHVLRSVTVSEWVGMHWRVPSGNGKEEG